MNEMLNKIKIAIKPKALFILGIGGIVLIALSSVFPLKSGSTKKANTLSTDEYSEKIKADITKIVTKISGDKNPTVVITLESGPRYTYADSRENDTAKTTGQTGDQNSEKTKRSYVTVRDSNGAETALIITENMPEIRGVAVVCSGGDDSDTADKIIGAVTAALNITSKRVYISGGTN